MQIGDGNVQINYIYHRFTWSDGVAPPPLVSVSGAVDSPYRGLSAFEEQDAPFFFGRETVTAQLLERMSRHLQDPGLLVVSGASGAGKSSLLRAGVLPRIRGAGLAAVPGSASWPCLLFTPTRAPLDELALRVALLAGADAATVRRGLETDPEGFALTVRQAALTRPPGAAAGAQPPLAGHPWPQPHRLLLVVDQFEQLFTQCPDERQRRLFIAALHAAASLRQGADHSAAAMVVLGVRADFEARCAAYPQLADPVQDRYLVRPMTGRQLRMAITEPAKKAGSMVEADLVEVLLREISARHPAASGSGVLPLLSHALDQAWRSRAGGTLTLVDYERTGGIEGAVAGSAQRAYDRLTPAQQAVARQVFARLTATSSDGMDVADRAARAELTDGRSSAEAGDVEAVLESFASERLVTLAAESVEISHEVLLTAWPLLRDTWLAETHADRIVRTRLRNAAAEWARQGRDPVYLYGGSLLQAAAGSADRIEADPARHPPLSQNERDFLRDSQHAQRRRARRRRGLIALLTALSVCLAAVAAFAVVSRQEALGQRDIAVAGQLVFKSEILAEANPRAADLEAVAAWRLDRSQQARYAMLSAAARPASAVLTGSSGPDTPVAFSPDGKTLATGGTIVRLWHAATRRPIARPLATHLGQVHAVVFSPGGTTLAVGGGNQGGDTGIVQLWDVSTGRLAGQWTASHFTQVNTVVFSPDGRTLATGDATGQVSLWDLATHRLIRRLAEVQQAVYALAFSPDGRILAIGQGDGS